MFNNPELQRNLWLEFSRHRIVVMPVVLLTIFFTAYLGDNNRFGEGVATTALWAYFLIVIVWGSRMSSEAVVQEINDRTWDNQRMSSLSPWTMTWGKFFGSTLFSWYGALFCLIVLMYSYPDDGWRRGPTLAYLIPLCVLTGLVAQAISFIASLVSIQKNSVPGRSLSSLYVLVSLIFVGYMAGFIFNASTTHVNWYGGKYSGQLFMLATLIVFFVWAIISAYRLMRVELQLKNRPIYWPLFVIFVAFYFAGFVAETETAYILKRSLVAYTIIVLLTYVMMFSDTKNPMLFRRLFYHLAAKNYKKSIEAVPSWFVTFILLFLMMMILVWQSNESFRFIDVQINFRFYVIAIFLFAIRDIALILFFNFSPKQGRADLTAFFYLLILYGLLPVLFNAAEIKTGIALFIPFDADNPYITLISAAVQALIVSLLVRQRWKNYYITKNA